MSKLRKPYKTYTKEFKLEAIRLMEESDRRPSDIAMEGTVNLTFQIGLILEVI